MPAAAVASLTPAIAGISGTSVGARGETAVVMRAPVRPDQTVAGPAPAIDVFRAGRRTRTWNGRALRPGHDDGQYYRSERSNSDFLLLRGRRHLGIRGLRRVGLGGFSRLVHTLDLGGFAQLGDVFGLGLARHIGLDLGLDLLEVGGLAGALFLDLDDVPAEWRLAGVGDFAGSEREGDRGESRPLLFLVEEAETAATGGAGVLGLLLRQLGEVAALLQLFGDRLGLVLGLDQDVPGVDFHFAGDLLGGFLVDLLHGLVGGRSLPF